VILFFYISYASHKVCRPEQTNHPTIEGIYSEIQTLINSAYNSNYNFRPNTIFAETKLLQYYEVVNKGPLMRKSSRMILKEFDPFMGSDYVVATYVDFPYLKSLQKFWDAANNASIFSDDIKYFQVIVYVDGLSVNEHPSPIYPTITSQSYYSGNSNYPVNQISNSGFPWTIVFFGFLFVFFTVFIIFIIRRRLKNNSFNQDEISVDDRSASNEYEQPNNQQTSYPIFVQSNNMNMNPQMTSYPIFVTNPQMQTNGVPIIFPQPQVFYPMQTNQMNPQ